MDAHTLTVPDALAPVARRLARRPSSRTATPRLSIVIVNYHQWDDVIALVRRLRASPAVRGDRAEVMIVDNHSPPHPAVAALRRLPGVSLRRWRVNHGFARAVNEGCRLGRGDWFLLLNPDVTIGPRFADEALALVNRLDVAGPSVGIVGLGLRNDDGSRQLSSGPFPTLWGTLGRLLLPRWRRKYSAPPADRASAVNWVTGCGLLVRRRCWDELGGFDRSFFLYYEDVDLCRRALALGWEVRHEPGLSLVHHHPLHTRRVPPALRLVTRHALLTYARKHWPRWQFHALAWIVRLEAWWKRGAARRRGDGEAATAFDALDGVAADLLDGRPAAAGRRLLRAVRHREEACGPLSVCGHPQS
jgi:GT2 family glycosyltransferase